MDKKEHPNISSHEFYSEDSVPEVSDVIYNEEGYWSPSEAFSQLIKPWADKLPSWAKGLMVVGTGAAFPVASIAPSVAIERAVETFFQEETPQLVPLGDEEQEIPADQVALIVEEDQDDGNEIVLVEVKDSTFRYRLKPGENSFTVADNFDISLEDLHRLNPDFPWTNEKEGEKVLIISDIAKITRENLPGIVESLGEVSHATLILPRPMSAQEIVTNLGLGATSEELIKQNLLQAEAEEILPAGVSLAISTEEGLSLGVEGHLVYLPSGVRLNDLAWTTPAGDKEINVFDGEAIYFSQVYIKVAQRLTYWLSESWSSANRHFHTSPEEYVVIEKTGEERGESLSTIDSETGERVVKMLPGEKIIGYRRQTRSYGDAWVSLASWDRPSAFTLEELVTMHGQIELPPGTSPEGMSIPQGQPVRPPMRTDEHRG